MKILIDISEDVFTRLFDNGSDANIEDLRQLETTVRKGTPIPEEKSAAELGGNNPRTDDEMTIGQAIKFLDEYSEYVECEKCHVESRECADHGCLLVRSVSAIKREYEEKNAGGK